MTVKELIEALQEFNPDAIVIFQTTEDTYTPAPHLRKESFTINYWSGDAIKLETIEKNTEFVEL